jgi:hypothetical protein
MSLHGVEFAGLVVGGVGRGGVDFTLTNGPGD